MSDTKIVKDVTVEQLAAESQACHDQLADQRGRIDAAYDLFKASSAAYYLMCRLESLQADNSSHEAVIALAEFKRLGLLQFDDKTANKLSASYVRSLKILKQTVDKSVEVINRLEQLTQLEQKLHQQQPLAAPEELDSFAQAVAELEAEEPL